MTTRHGARPSDEHGRETEYDPFICPCCGKPWLGPQRSAGVAESTPANQGEEHEVHRSESD